MQAVVVPDNLGFFTPLQQALLQIVLLSGHRGDLKVDPVVVDSSFPFLLNLLCTQYYLHKS